MLIILIYFGHFTICKFILTLWMRPSCEMRHSPAFRGSGITCTMEDFGHNLNESYYTLVWSWWRCSVLVMTICWTIIQHKWFRSLMSSVRCSYMFYFPHFYLPRIFKVLKMQIGSCSLSLLRAIIRQIDESCRLAVAFSLVAPAPTLHETVDVCSILQHARHRQICSRVYRTEISGKGMKYDADIGSMSLWGVTSIKQQAKNASNTNPWWRFPHVCLLAFTAWYLSQLLPCSITITAMDLMRVRKVRHQGQA